MPYSSQFSRFRKHRLEANRVERVLIEMAQHCVNQSLVKSNALLIDSTHTFASTQKREALDVISDATKRLLHPRHHQEASEARQKLPNVPKTSCEKESQEIAMLLYLASLGATVEDLLPDAEGFYMSKTQMLFKIQPGFEFRKARQGKKNVGSNRVLVYCFDVENCKTCPLRDGCYHPDARRRKRKHTISARTPNIMSNR